MRIACDSVFPVAANTYTKSIQKQIKSIDVDKVRSKKPLAINPVSCRINRLLISRSNHQASETECHCKSVLVSSSHQFISCDFRGCW